MATTADYLNKLVTQKNTLADNLVTKGVEATHDETLETLVPKVLEISGGGGGSGIYPIGENGRPTGNVVVPSGVTTLDKYVFSYNSNVTSITFSEGLVSIGTDGCRNATALQSVAFPSTFSSFGSYAFMSCTILSDIVLADNIGNLTVSDYAFSGCSALSNDSVNKISERATSIGNNAFAGCNNITSITAYSASGNNCFANCKGLLSVIILHTNSVGSFGTNVFSGCASLESVTLPIDTIKISDGMFMNTKINNINIPNGTTSIGTSTFSDCKNLSNIIIPTDTAFSLGNNAFQGCTALQGSMVNEILNHATLLGNYLFKGCTGLTNVTAKYVSENAFDSCTNLVTAEIVEPYNGKIANLIFTGCTSLESCILPNNATTIGINVFYNCTALKTVYLPSSITSATNNSLSHSSSYYIFRNCTALEDVQLGQDWNMSLSVNSSENLTVQSMITMFNSLKDLTGETAKTLTLGSVNLAKLTDEQKTIATNKNWTLA